MKNTFNHSHLLSIKDLSVHDINTLLDTAQQYAYHNRNPEKILHNMAGKTIINIFFENSTRTLTSFELAGKRLSAHTINIPVSTSSIKKGETLNDTIETLNAMLPDALVIRHAHSGAVRLLAEKAHCAVLNAGDGLNEHPTQALLDALTIRTAMKRLDGITVAICGDIIHSRVARSNIYLLQKMRATVHVIAPPTLLPADIDALGIKVFTDMKKGLKDVDIIMLLRLQKERMTGGFIPSVEEYNTLYGLNLEKLRYTGKKSFVMHPGPMNRGIEIDDALADNTEISLIHNQVEMGVAVRMACLDLLTRTKG